MKVLILGGTSFIGTNLALALAQLNNVQVTIADKSEDYYKKSIFCGFNNVSFVESSLDNQMDFDGVLAGHEVLYHLVSTTVPTTSNAVIPEEIESNIVFSSKLFDSCIKNQIKKIIFISSGGTVYGKDVMCPIHEDTPTNPISSYGIQKVTIEKLLYLYNYLYGIDYRVIRLANPYGPYQRPNGVLGAVTTFTYKAIKNDEITVYGDGSVVRDYIYISDAIKGILNIASDEAVHKTYNLGSGVGTSVNDVIAAITSVLQNELNVVYKEGRKVDVPSNYLDVSRYENEFGTASTISLKEGIKLTADHLIDEYDLQK